MNHDELRQAIAIADTSNNEGTRLSMKIDAILEYLLSPGEPVDVEPIFLGPGANDTVMILAAAKALEEALTRPLSEAEAIQQMYGIPVQPDEAQVLEDAAAVEAVLTGGYANHASQAPSTSLYDVMPERKKLERMTVEDLKALAARHGITLTDGTKATIIDSMIGPEASGP